MGRYDLFRKMASSNLNQKGREVKTIKDSIIYDFKSSPSYVQGYINNNTETLIDFHIITDRLKNTKKLLSYPNEYFNIGDVIDIVDLNIKFLVVDIDEDQQIQTKGTIQQCNNTLKFYTKSNKNQLSWDIPCIVGNVSINNEDSKYIKTVDNELPLVVSNNEITRQIKPNDIYKIGMYNYQIISVPDDISIPGLLQFKLKYIETQQPLPSYSIEILNGETVSIQQGSNIQLNVQVKDGSEILTTPPSCLFVSSDDGILNVNSEGFVTSLSVGSAIVTCKLQSDESVYDTISITVEEIPVDNYTISIIGVDSIKINQSAEYDVKVYNNGIEVYGIDYTWNLIGTYASITSHDSTSAVVKAGSTSGKSVTLKVSKSDDVNVFAEKLISITGLW